MCPHALLLPRRLPRLRPRLRRRRRCRCHRRRRRRRRCRRRRRRRRCCCGVVVGEQRQVGFTKTVKHSLQPATATEDRSASPLFTYSQL